MLHLQLQKKVTKLLYSNHVFFTLLISTRKIPRKIPVGLGVGDGGTKRWGKEIELGRYAGFQKVLKPKIRTEKKKNNLLNVLSCCTIQTFSKNVFFQWIHLLSADLVDIIKQFFHAFFLAKSQPILHVNQIKQ